MNKTSNSLWWGILKTNLKDAQKQLCSMIKPMGKGIHLIGDEYLDI
jgi:hypothetical protein